MFFKGYDPRPPIPHHYVGFAFIVDGEMVAASEGQGVEDNVDAEFITEFTKMIPTCLKGVPLDDLVEHFEGAVPTGLKGDPQFPRPYSATAVTRVKNVLLNQ